MDNRQLIRTHLRYLANRQLRDESIRHRRLTLMRVAGQLSVPLADVALVDLEDWRDEQARRMKPASVKTYVCHVRAFYAWAHKHAGLPENPAADLTAPRIRPGRPRPIPEDELTTALRCAADPVRLYLVLAAYLGLRCAEIAHLEPGCLSKDGRHYVIDVLGKGGRRRTLPCPDLIAEMLRPHLRRAREGVVFRCLNGAPMTPGHLSKQLNGLLRGLGIGATAHQLRHRYGSVMYELADHDIRLIQELLGHASPSTTAVYVAANARRGARVADQLARSLGPAPRPERADDDADEEAA